MNTQKGSATQLRNPWLTGARAAWIIVATMTMIVLVLGVLEQIREPLPSWVSAEVACNPIALSVEDLEAAGAIGLSEGFVTGLASVLNLAFNLTYIFVAMFIFWRKSDDWMALLLSLALLTPGAPCSARLVPCCTQQDLSGS